MSEIYVGLDFETYSDVDITVHGLERYVSSPNFKVLLAVTSTTSETYCYDFVKYPHQVEYFKAFLMQKEVTIVAHNAGFERRVLQAMGVHLPADRFEDSAVWARVAGAGSSLEAAAPQLLGSNKIESGKDLIRLFSIPHQDYLTKGGWFNSRVIDDHPDEWADFIHYCKTDAYLSLEIFRHCQRHGVFTSKESKYQAITMSMNFTGWPVDVELVKEMQRRYEENLESTLKSFRDAYGEPDLNLNSLKQLKEWCADRGVRATSFDEKNLSRMLDRLTKRLEDTSLSEDKRANYQAVRDLLRTKQILGGSSLKKLQVILDSVGSDGRLRDQYLHCGAGQTLRTTGRSVQMQNLKRLSSPADVDVLVDPSVKWSNDKLAENLRQVFTASHPQGRLIVGDFSSVESRGLAYLADEAWKMVAYKGGMDLYKTLASKIYSVDYDDVSKAQRQVGKVGELSCGYGAGPSAVQSFAEGMGVEMSEGEAVALVSDWRAANPRIVSLWGTLDELLHYALETGKGRSSLLRDDLFVRVMPVPAPASLLKQRADTVSLRVTLARGTDEILTRVFHGCYVKGRNICYFKPSARKTGDLWSDSFVNPKTKQRQNYTIYGGKLAGILTQSFCREIFFERLERVAAWTQATPGVYLIGQFHDEIVLDWVPVPSGIKLTAAEQSLHDLMSDTLVVPGFPLAAEVKSDYRYTK